MKKLKSLGSKVATPSSPSVRTLEAFKSPGIDTVEFVTKEFTSLCPVTGQPDFAEVLVEYSPNELCLESKSLKLYLQSYRNEKGFIEQLACRIHDDIREAINPDYLNIEVKSVPRGGISLQAWKSSSRRPDEA